MFGLFSKKTKLNPIIETQGLKIEYKIEYDLWMFSCKSIDFIASGTKLWLPTQDQLMSIITDVQNLIPEMTSRLEKGWKEYGDIKNNDGEGFSVNITDFHLAHSFLVSWSDGALWGDMSIDFTIKDHKIENEEWGD